MCLVFAVPCGSHFWYLSNLGNLGHLQRVHVILGSHARLSYLTQLAAWTSLQQPSSSFVLGSWNMPIRYENSSENILRA